MENVNITLAANILKYRKKSGLSQDELAQKLGVTFQAVSKWENAKAAPDIAFLPKLILVLKWLSREIVMRLRDNILRLRFLEIFSQIVV